MNNNDNTKDVKLYITKNSIELLVYNIIEYIDNNNDKEINLLLIKAMYVEPQLKIIKDINYNFWFSINTNNYSDIKIILGYKMIMELSKLYYKKTNELTNILIYKVIDKLKEYDIGIVDNLFI